MPGVRVPLVDLLDDIKFSHGVPPALRLRCLLAERGVRFDRALGLDCGDISAPVEWHVDPATGDIVVRQGDTTPLSRSPFTWEARAEVQPIVHVGTKEDCEAWMRAIGGREVFVLDAEEKPVAIGIVTRTVARILT